MLARLVVYWIFSKEWNFLVAGMLRRYPLVLADILYVISRNVCYSTSVPR